MDYTFEVQLAKSIADAFSGATGLGCAATSTDGGDTICAAGMTCEHCRLCAHLGRDASACMHTHRYGMAEAERFGGKYIYFCRRGLAFFTSPIFGLRGSEAKLTVGPFLMVDRAEFLACELDAYPVQPVLAELREDLPQLAPKRVTSLSQLLFMTVGFLNNVSVSAELREQEATEQLQGQINAYIAAVKGQEEQPYPFEKEKALMQAISHADRGEAERLLNELLGVILLLSGPRLELMKTRVFELLVMMSRAAIDGGAETAPMQDWTYRCFARIQSITGMEELCFWLTKAMREMIDSVFQSSDAKHADMIHRTQQYIRQHLCDRLTVEELARNAYLSPDYFGRIFKEETGQTVQQTILDTRLRRARELMKQPGLKLSEIAAATGFTDQSYFCRVFQHAYHLSPRDYRKQL